MVEHGPLTEAPDSIADLETVKTCGVEEQVMARHTVGGEQGDDLRDRQDNAPAQPRVLSLAHRGELGPMIAGEP